MYCLAVEFIFAGLLRDVLIWVGLGWAEVGRVVLSWVLLDFVEFGWIMLG